MKIEKILTQKLQNSNIRISGPPNNTAKTFVISQLLTPLFQENRVIFWLTQDDKEAESIFENVKFWQNIKPINKNKTKIKKSTILPH